MTDLAGTEPFDAQRLAPLMVAPNGARLTDDDHPAVPVTIPQIVDCARACAAEGAGAMHFHVRDQAKAHILDSGLYREALAELKTAVPNMHLQITTETVGRYGPEDMRRVTKETMPPGVSIGVPEMIPSGEPSEEDAGFYNWLADQQILTQHICYAPAQVDLLARLLDRARLSKTGVWCLFVIGHYTGALSRTELIGEFLSAMAAAGIDGDWAICAFRQEEAACLHHAIERGGKVRIGFENSLYMADGSIAADNMARVREVRSFLAGTPQAPDLKP